MPDQPRSISSATSVPCLIPQGSFLGKPDIPLNRTVITVGSSDKSRLHLVSSTVSASHALFVKTAGQTYICDLASRTGIQVNGKPTSFTYLKTGDRVQIGRFVFRFRAPESPTPPPFPPNPPPASIDITGEMPVDLGEKPIFTIGRRDNNDLPLTGDTHVSTVHAVIFAMDGNWYLRDLHSRKGTRLNGSGIHQHQLEFSDEITVGQFTMRFQPAESPSASGLDFSVEQPQEMDLSADLPMPVADEAATVPLDAEELAAEAPIPLDDLMVEPSAKDEPPALESEEPVAAEAEIPLELDELAPEPQEMDFATPELNELPAATPEAELPLELDEPLHNIPALPEVSAEAVAEPDEPHVPRADRPERPPVPITLPAEPAYKNPFEELHLDDLPDTPAEPDDLDLSLLESLEPVSLIESEPSVQAPLDLESEELSLDQPAAIEESTSTEVPQAEREVAFSESTPEIPLDLAEPDFSIPAPELPAVQNETIAEPDEFDLSSLEMLEPIPSIEFELSVQTPLEFEEPSLEPHDAVAEAAPEIPPESELPTPTLESEASIQESLELEQRASEPLSPEPSATDADIITDLDELDLSSFESEPSTRTPLELEPPAVEAKDADLIQPDLPAPATTEPPAAEADIITDLDELDLSSFESEPPVAVEPPATVADIVTDLDELDLSSFESEPPTVDAKDLEPLQPDLPVPAIEASASGADIVTAFDELDLSLLDSLETAPSIEPVSPAPAAVEPEELPSEPPAAAAKVELAVPIPADVADLIYTEETPSPTPEPAPIKPVKPAKPKRKWFGRKKKAAKTAPVMEILDATEPTLESALEDLGAAVDAPPATVPEFLSDTTFGRAVEEFAGSSTGPIIDQPPTEVEIDTPTFSSATEDRYSESAPPVPPAADEPAAPMLDLSQIPDGEDFVAMPEIETAAETTAAPAPIDQSSLTYSSTENNQQTLSHLPMDEAPPTPSADETPATAQAGEPAPIFPSAEETWQSQPPLAQAEPPIAEIQPPAPSADEIPATLQAGEPAPIFPSAEDNGQSQPPLAEVVPPIAELPLPAAPVAETSAAAAPIEQPEPPRTTAAPSRPSIFGFQFEGGSFLGGMPLDLKPVPQKFAPSTTVSPVFDLPPPRVPIPPTPANEPRTFTSYSPPTEPVAMPIKPPPVAEPPPPPPAPVSEAPPPPPAPPVKAAPLPRPKSLGDAMAVPPLAKSVTTPPPPRRSLTTAFDGLTPGRSLAGGMVGGTQKPPPPARGFVGHAAREAVRGSDVFSQIAAPISVEVFGAIQGNADQFVIPDIRKPLIPSPPRSAPPPPPPAPPAEPQLASEPEPEPIPADSNGDLPLTAEDLEDAGIPTEPLAEMLQPAEPEPPIAAAIADEPPPMPASPKSRQSRVPLLLVIMILLLAGVWGGVYYFISPASRVTGTLGFSNLASQPMAVQNTFHDQQKARLQSAEVRNMALSMLPANQQETSFLKDAVQFDNATTHAGSIDFIDNGQTLELTTRVTDAAFGKAQVDALLQSLKQKDADLLDTLARAQRADTDATAAVSQAKAHLEDLKSQLAVDQARGENRPDPQEMASVTADSERLNKIWTVAKSDLADAQTAMADLNASSADHPATADTDPQLGRLRRQASDLDQQISELQLVADAGHSTLDQDNQLQDLKTQSDDIAARIKQRQAEITADQSLSAGQREVNGQKAIEAISIKMTGLQKAESDAGAAAKASAAKLAALNTRLDQARQASTDSLIPQISAATTDLKSKTDDAGEKEIELASCISLAGEAQVSVQALPDQRPIFAGVASIVILGIFSLMIVSASRSSSIPVADRPAPHPQPHAPDDADEPSPAST